MRKDICCTYDRDVVEVFEAYVRAIRDAFAKDCTPQYYHTISFGLNFSFFYNMTGGVCTVHLMPYQNGTAVDVRYTVVQPVAGRYGAHCLALTQRVEQILGCLSKPASIDVNLFLRPENQLIAPGDPRFPAANAVEGNAAASASPAPDPAPAPSPTPEETTPPAPAVPEPMLAPEPAPAPEATPTVSAVDARCASCGAALSADALFCSKCGTPRVIPQKEKLCSACGSTLEADACFCSRCGARQAT